MGTRYWQHVAQQQNHASTSFQTSVFLHQCRALLWMKSRDAQVSVFDTINAAGGYSRKVRRLGEFHADLARLRTPDAQDIDDPLYGNAGGAGEQVCGLVCF